MPNLRSIILSAAAFTFAARLAAGTTTPPPAGGLEGLLARIAERQAEVSRLSNTGSYTATMTIEELDRKGKPESTSESTVRVTHDGDTKTTEILRVIRDGKDVTEEEKKNQKEAKAEREKEEREKAKGKKDEEKEETRSITISVSDPFAHDEQRKYRFSIAGRDPADPGRVRIRFEPKGKPAPDTNVGEAIVESATGAVHRIAYHPSKNPRFVDRMDVVLEYDPASPVGPVISRMSIDGEGGLLFVRKKMRSTTTFSDWARPSPSAVSE